MRIDATDLRVKIKGRDIVSGLTFSSAPGDSVALTGPSGCGKTTLMNALGRLLPIAGGTLLLNGQDATRWGERSRRRFWRTSAAFILQDYGLVDDEPVAYNVTLSKPLWGRKIPEGVLDALDKVGLKDRAHDPAIQLSGGERRRVAIARAMYRKATVIFADEPTASLDDDNRAIVQELLLAETRRGCTVVIATHDAALAGACTTKVELERLKSPLSLS